MKNFLTTFHSIVSCLVLCVLLTDQAFFAEANDKRIICEFPKLPTGSKPPYDTGNIPTELCTDLVYTVSFDDETFQVDIPSDEEERLRIRKFASLGSRYSNLNYFLDVSGPFPVMMADASKRSSFIASALRPMREFGFNGLNLHLWYLKVEDMGNILSLIEELVNAFKEYGYLLTSSVSLRQVVKSYVSNTVSGVDFKRISELLDWINVDNTYLRIPDDFLDCPCPLYRRPFDKGEFEHLNVHDGLDIMVRLGAHRHKLMVGIPFSGNHYYSLNFTDVSIGSILTNVSIGYRMDYSKICQILPSGEWTKRFDHIGECPYMFNKDGIFSWIGYEDEQSISIKMDYINRMGYGGAIVQSLHMDDYRGLCGPKNPLLDTLHRTLLVKKKEIVDSPELMLRKRLEAMGIIPKGR